MRAVYLVLAGALVQSAFGQGRTLDWPFFGGDAQRTGWQKSDLRITKENVKDFELVLQRKLEQKGGANSLTPPLVIGNLISYKGFKELGFVAGRTGRLWSVDLDTNRVFWQKDFKVSGSACGGAGMAVPTLTPPTNFAAPRPRPTSASPGAPPSPAAAQVAAAKPSLLGSTAFGAPRPAFALTADGKLHVLNTSTGDDVVDPIAFLPAHMRASSLTIADGVLYTTASECSGKAGAVYAIDLNSEDKTVATYRLSVGAPEGLGGLAIGVGGNVYVSGSDGSLVALAPRTLTLLSSAKGIGRSIARATPVVFTWKERDMIVAPTADGRLALIDPRQIAMPVARTPVIGALWGGISSWVDQDGTRWVAAPVWGPIDSALKFGITNGPAPNGAIAAFKVDEPNGTPVLTPAWTSRDLNSPEPPVITSGIVFALAAGTVGKKGAQATLYAFDGATGNEMYSTKDQVKEPANLNGVTVANGRVFFTTVSGTLYGFGIHLEI